MGLVRIAPRSFAGFGPAMVRPDPGRHQHGTLQSKNALPADRANKKQFDLIDANPFCCICGAPSLIGFRIQGAGAGPHRGLAALMASRDVEGRNFSQDGSRDKSLRRFPGKIGPPLASCKKRIRHISY